MRQEESARCWPPAIAAIVASAVLSGCVPIVGTLEVRERVRLTVTEVFEDADTCAIADFDADCERYETRRDITVPAGRHQAELDMSDRSALTLRLNQQDNTRQEIRFSRPQALRVPEKEGRFTLLAHELAQPVDVSGTVSTDSTHSNLRRELEFCSYEVERWSCKAPHYGAAKNGTAKGLAHEDSGDESASMPADPGTLQVSLRGAEKGRHAHKQRHHRRPRCGWRTIRIRGTRQVAFFLEYETRTVALDLLSPGTRKTLAHFEGAQTRTHKHYQRIGACF